MYLTAFNIILVLGPFTLKPLLAKPGPARSKMNLSGANGADLSHDQRVIHGPLEPGRPHHMFDHEL
jgi:hypothetical protein